jgi:Zn/Cd-binding protein ZinT
MSKEKEKAKEAEKAESKSYEYQKIDLKTGLNDIAFKNKQVEMIRNLQEENLKLKQGAGRQRRQAGMGDVKGLRGLEGNLGMQFRKKG